MSKKSVAVLFGGRSAEHDASMESAAAIISHMSDEKYLTVPIYVTRDGKWLLYDGPLSNFKTVSFEKFGSKAVISPDTEHMGLLRIVNGRVKNIPLDVVFPLIANTQGLLELAGIPYIGCESFSAEICEDKEYIKQIAREVGLEQCDYFEFYENDLEDMSQITKKVRYKLGYPAVVYPDGGRVENKKELEEAIERATLISSKITVKKELSGKVIECIVLGDETNAEGSILNNTEGISDETVDLIIEKAVAIFKTARCYGLAQVVFILQEDGSLLLEKIKTIPDYAAISGYTGYKNDVLIDRLVDMALKRHGR